MADISAVSAASNAAQLIEQARQTAPRPEANETRAAETNAEQRTERQPEAEQAQQQQQQAQPVVNAQGETTGRVVNTFA
jgi:hypothetical protein